MGSAHAAQAGGDGECSGEGAAEFAAGDFGEAFVGALQDALGTDVYPGTGGHLAVHHEAFGFEAAEFAPVGPVGYQMRVGDKHSGGPFMGAEDADRFAGLHEHGFVIVEGGEGAFDGVVGVPGAGGSTGASVDHEIFGAFGYFGVEVVLQHPVGGFLGPSFTGQIGAAGCVDGLVHGVFCL